MNNKVAILTFMLTISISAPADNWPGFRGNNRTGNSVETSLLKEWPQEGLQKVWEYKGVGTGYSSPCVVDDQVYTAGMIDSKGVLFCIDKTGKLKWKTEYGDVLESKYAGTRTTPTYDNGKLYIYTTTGHLICFNAGDGEKLWDVDTVEKYQAKKIFWNLTESPLVYDNKVICTMGGESCLIAAFDKTTGSVVWKNSELKRKSAYCSPILVNHKNKPLIITNIEGACIGLNAKTGKLLWEVPLKGKYDQNQVPPLYSKGLVFITNARGADPTVFKISDDATSVDVVWKNKVLENDFGGVVLHDNYLYGATKRGWVCQELSTGKQMWKERGIGQGSIIFADGRLYLYSYKGQLALIEASPEKYKQISTMKLPDSTQKKQNYSHLAISNGKLYVRHGDTMLVFNIAQ